MWPCTLKLGTQVGGSSAWLSLLQDLRHLLGTSAQVLVLLLDLSPLANELGQGTEEEAQSFLQQVLRRFQAWFPARPHGRILEGPLLALVLPWSAALEAEFSLPELRHRALQARFRWQQGHLPLRGRLLAVRLSRSVPLETLPDQLREALYQIPPDAWTWGTVPPPPSAWERFWHPWLEPWLQRLQSQRRILWITGGTALDREIVLDLLRQAWARWGFSLLQSCPLRAGLHPYAALLEALCRHQALHPSRGEAPWQTLLDPQERFSMAQARQWLTEAVLSLSSHEPLLLMIPEFQRWAPESRHVLKHLIRTPGNFSLVISSAHPPEPALQDRVDLQKLPDLREVLTPAALSALFPELHHPEVLTWLLQDPSTHRLHCLRVLYALRGSQALTPAEPDPPRRVLESLPAAERRFLRLLALLQDPLDLDLVRAVTDLPAVVASALLHRLAAFHLLRTDGLDTFLFPLTPLKKHLLASLPHHRRQELHRRVLRAKQAQPQRFSAATHLPHHLALGHYGQALHLLLDLAHEWAHQGAPLSALQALRRAVRLARFDTSLQERLRTGLHLPDLLPHPHRLEALPAVQRESSSLAEDLALLDLPEAHFVLNDWRARLLLHLGRYEEAEELVHTLAQEGAATPQALARLLELRGLTAWYRDHWSESMQCWKQALVYAQEAQDPELVARLLGNLGMVYLQQHRILLALKHYAGALRLYRRLGDRRAIGIGLGMVGHVFRAWGHLTRALQYYRRAARISLQAGDTYHVALWKAEEGLVYTDLALWEEGMPLLLEALSRARTLEATYLLASLQGEILWVQARRGYTPQALRGLEHLAERLQRRGIIDLALRARLYQVHLLVDTGHLAHALDLLEHLETRILPQHPQFRDAVDLAWIHYENARGAYHRAKSRFPRWFEDLSTPVPSGIARLTIDVLRATTLVGARDPRASKYLEEAWRHVERLAHSLPHPEQARRFLRRHPEVRELRRLRRHLRTGWKEVG